MAKHLIYLAAGSGRRFGGNKLLYSLEGRPLFSYGLETLRRAARLRPECEVTVVSRYPQILKAAQTAGVRAVDSPQSVGGISHTIRAALDALPPVSGEDFLFFAVADQPWLEADTLLRLVDAARPGVPGGTVMASLGLITSVLGFDNTGTGLMMTIFALQDSFGTACNITGDGALTLMLTGYAKKHGIEEVETPDLL